MSARIKLYEYIRDGGIKSYTSEELRNIGKISDWARVMRQLRQDSVIEYEYNGSVYNVSAFTEFKKTTTRSGLSSKDKYKIRNRDGHKCQSCGKGVNDDVKLHVDHKIPIEWNGSNNDDNLWTLCDDCNQAKKDFFKDDFDAKVMKLVSEEKSGYKKLKVLFENSPNKKFSPSILQGVSGIRDWTRTIRDIRTRHEINIIWFDGDEEFPNGYYSNIQ